MSAVAEPLLAAVTRQLPHVLQSALSRVAWALATLGLHDTPSTTSLCHLAGRAVPRLDGTQLSNLVWAMTKFDHADGVLLGAVGDRVVVLIARNLVAPPDLARLLWSFAQLKYHPPPEVCPPPSPSMPVSACLAGHVALSAEWVQSVLSVNHSKAAQLLTQCLFGMSHLKSTRRLAGPTLTREHTQATHSLSESLSMSPENTLPLTITIPHLPLEVLLHGGIHAWDTCVSHTCAGERGAITQLFASAQFAPGSSLWWAAASTLRLPLAPSHCVGPVNHEQGSYSPDAASRVAVSRTDPHCLQRPSLSPCRDLQPTAAACCSPRHQVSTTSFGHHRS